MKPPNFQPTPEPTQAAETEKPDEDPPKGTTQPATPAPAEEPTPTPTSTAEDSGSSSNVDVSSIASLRLIVGERYFNTQGQTAQFSVEAKDRAGNIIPAEELPLNWTSSRVSDFQVDENGLVTALVTDGYTEISVALNGTNLSSKQLISVISNVGYSSNRNRTVNNEDSFEQPVVTGFSVDNGSSLEVFTLTGEGFDGATDVVFTGGFGDISAFEFEVLNDGEIEVRIPTGPVIDGPITVVNPDFIGSSEDDFTVNQRIWLVDESADGDESGNNWENAYTDLQAVLGLGEDIPAGDEIWVAEGVYYPSSTGDQAEAFELIEDVNLYGGFEGGELAREDRDWEANITRLSGDLDDNDIVLDPVTYIGNVFEDETRTDNSYHVVIGADNTTIDGFYISNGNANGEGGFQREGGGMFNNDVSPTMENLQFERNFSGFDGGALYNTNGADPQLDNVDFLNNVAQFGGAMVNINNGGENIYINNSTMSENYAYANGGAIYNDTASPTIENSLLISNVTNGDGGAINNIDDSHPVLRETVIRFNSAQNGGGMATETSTVDFNRVLFDQNTASGNGGGLYLTHIGEYFEEPASDSRTLGDNHLRDVIFDRNQADLGGGLFYYREDYNDTSDWETTLVNVVVSLNEGTTEGGGIYVDGNGDNNGDPDLEINLINMTFHANTTGGEGTGVYLTNEGVDISTNLLLFNDVFYDQDAPPSGSVVDPNGSFLRTEDPDDPFEDRFNPPGPDDTDATIDDGLHPDDSLCVLPTTEGDLGDDVPTEDIVGTTWGTMRFGAYEYDNSACDS